jgi:serine/threonine protein kinase
MIGKTLALYEITGQLGKGGMGEVYQAKDQKLQYRKTISINRALFNQALG